MAEPGDWIWVQLLSRDAKKASEFLSRGGGYEVVENTRANRLSDYVLTSKGYARATVATIPEGKRKCKPSWLPFVRVKSVRESVALANRSAAKPLLEPKPNSSRAAQRDCEIHPARDCLLEWSDSLVKGALA